MYGNVWKSREIYKKYTELYSWGLNIIMYLYLVLFSGHVMVVKNQKEEQGTISGKFISLGGIRMEDGRTWGMADDLVARTITVSDTSVEVGPVTVLKLLQVTASHKNKTSRGSVTPKLLNAAYVDMKDPSSDELELVIYGGQKVDLLRSSSDVVVIKGELTHDNMSDEKLDVTQFPTKKPTFEEFKIPAGWSDGQNLVQKGEIPEGRMGAKMSKIRENDLIVTGGHCKPGVGRKMYHPMDNCYLLSYPDMTWKRLESHEVFQRSFHCQAVDNNGMLFIVGGMTFDNDLKKWTTIKPLNEVTSVQLCYDDSYVVTNFTLTTYITDIGLLTNYSSCNIDKILYVYSGFIFPKYDHQERNLFEFQPPIAKKNKLPEFSKKLFKIDLEEKTITEKCGPSNGGASGGTMLPLSDNDLIIHADPIIYLVTNRQVSPKKCDLPELYGSCTITYTVKNQTVYICMTPTCRKKVHIACDKSLKKNSVLTNLFCPSCKGLDKHWKKSK